MLFIIRSPIRGIRQLARAALATPMRIERLAYQRKAVNRERIAAARLCGLHHQARLEPALQVPRGARRRGLGRCAPSRSCLAPSRTGGVQAKTTRSGVAARPRGTQRRARMSRRQKEDGVCASPQANHFAPSDLDHQRTLSTFSPHAEEGRTDGGQRLMTLYVPEVRRRFRRDPKHKPCLGDSDSCPDTRLLDIVAKFHPDLSRTVV